MTATTAMGSQAMSRWGGRRRGITLQVLTPLVILAFITTPVWALRPQQHRIVRNIERTSTSNLRHFPKQQPHPGVGVGSGSGTTPPRVLAINAHPDDETEFAATLWKIANDIGGTVDLAIISDGQGGFHYSTGGEYLYRQQLTNETVARQLLQRIRKKEQLEAAEALGIRDVFFLDQPDYNYTVDINPVISGPNPWWDVQLVQHELAYLLQKGAYDYVVCFLPVPGTHGEHKAAAVMALQAVQTLLSSGAPAPIIIGASQSNSPYTTLTGYPITAASAAPVASFNRTTPFGYKNGLNYNIFVNYAIAAHRSQGALLMELTQTAPAMEYFYLFNINPSTAQTQVQALFQQLANTPFQGWKPGSGWPV